MKLITRFFSGLIKKLLFLGLFVAIGWYGGNRYGAPANITEPIDKVVDKTVNFVKPKLKEYLDKIRGEGQNSDAANPAEASARTAQINAAIANPWIENRRAALPLLTKMQLCPFQVSNAPLFDSKNNIIDFKPYARVNGVELRIAPIGQGCLSSGFGRRGVMQKMHKGLDYSSKRGRTEIVAPADGVIVEAGYHDDFGIQLILDHGRGVFTRLAHLETLHSGVELGRSVFSGVPVGIMGDTGKYNTAKHLHYEILVGDYTPEKASFGLKAVDPFSGKVTAPIKTSTAELR